MTRPMLPRIKSDMTAGARAVAKGATPALTRLMTDGVKLTSPHDQETNEAILASLPSAWRESIFLISYANASCVNIELKPPISEVAALAIGKAF
jgi:hypothetical protein